MIAAQQLPEMIHRLRELEKTGRAAVGKTRCLSLSRARAKKLLPIVVAMAAEPADIRPVC